MAPGGFSGPPPPTSPGNYNVYNANVNNANNHGTGKQNNNFDKGAQNFYEGGDQEAQRREVPGDPRDGTVYTFTSPLDKELSQEELRDEEEAFMGLTQDQQQYRYVVEGRPPPDDCQSALDDWQAIFNQTNRQDVQEKILSSILELAKYSDRVPLCTTLRGIEYLGKGPVGYGVFASVWRGRLRGREMAVKVLRYRVPHLQDHVESLLRQSILWRQLDHRNLNPFHGVHYFAEDQQQLCLVSPWIEQGNVLHYVQTAKNPDQQSLARDVARGLSYLHEKNVVHGSLKGYNVLVKSDLSACITDFGLFDALTKYELSDMTTPSIRDQGHPVRWLAPEVISGGERSRESDIYAFGYVCYEIYAKCIPFHDKRDCAIATTVSTGDIRLERPSNIGKLWELVQKCWSSDPRSRPTAGDLLLNSELNGSDNVNGSIQSRPAASGVGASSYLNRRKK